MKKKYLIVTTAILIIFIETSFGRHNITTRSFGEKPSADSIKFDDTRVSTWSEDFEVLDITSTIDGNSQKAYVFKSKSKEPKPLIVSLHTWSGDYSQKDDLAEICKQKDINYIHPDFRGANWTKDACCSDLAIGDIDDAILFALDNFNVDTTKVFVIGVSGGGYATLSTFMKSRHKISKFSAWASISDLIAWYEQSKIRRNGYADNILACTNSINELNEINAKQKSPLYWDMPLDKLLDSELYIYAGIYDGIQGSVPITHSINFYNKLLTDMSVADSSKYVSPAEKLKLLEFRKSLGDYGSINGREVSLIKSFKNIKLVIFKGNHEMLTEFALNELLEE